MIFVASILSRFSKLTLFTFIISAVQPPVILKGKFLICICSLLSSPSSHYFFFQKAFRYLDKGRKRLNERQIVRISLFYGESDFVVVEQKLEQMCERVAIPIILSQSDFNKFWNVVISQFVGEGLRWHQNLGMFHLFAHFTSRYLPEVNQFLHELA